MEKNSDKRTLLLDAIFFEHWARYFCFEESADGMNAVIEIPAQVYARCAEQEPRLAPLLEKIQHSPIELDGVKTAIFSFVQEQLCMSDADFAAFMQEMSLDGRFNRTLNVFYGFVQEEADNDAKTEDAMSDEEYKAYRRQKQIPPFSEWIEQFKTWAADNNYPL